MKQRIKAGMVGLLAMLFLMVGVETKAQDRPETVVFTINGKVVDQKECLAIKYLQGTPGLNTSQEIESITVYQVRGNRPVKKVSVDGTAALQELDLVAWALSDKSENANASANVEALPAKAGDRIAMHVVFKNGKSGTVNLCLK